MKFPFFSKPRVAIDDDIYFTQLRKREYPLLDLHKQIYLDYTGGNLYPQSLVKKHQHTLLSNVLGNPHSTNPTSLKATHLVEEARDKVIEFFNAQDYICVFTANASAALKIVGESFPFTTGSEYLLTADNHNSVHGIRHFCTQKGGNVEYVKINYEDLRINEEDIESQFSKDKNNNALHLFAFPAQSNSTGVKHSQSLIQRAHDAGYKVLYDAAAYVPTSKLDLSQILPDFVSMSFYKIFGYPTGIGCLLIHKNVFGILKKPWFAGGTVTMVSVMEPQHFLANGHERFEDGTLSYSNIPAVKSGFEFIESIGIQRINARIHALVNYLITQLSLLLHRNGNPIVRIFGPDHLEERGGNVIMNFFDTDGHVIPVLEVEEVMNQKKISIRSGCFCNPGIDEINNCITSDQMKAYFASRDKGDWSDIQNFLGKLRGTTRVSVGIATTKRDIDLFIQVVNTFKDRSH